MHILVREGRLVRISDHLVYLPEQIEELLARLGDLPERFTVAAFRDAMGLTRKYAVPLLEWLDGSGATVRHGDECSLTGRPAPIKRAPTPSATPLTYNSPLKQGPL